MAGEYTATHMAECWKTVRMTGGMVCLQEHIIMCSRCLPVYIFSHLHSRHKEEEEKFCRWQYRETERGEGENRENGESTKWWQWGTQPKSKGRQRQKVQRYMEKAGRQAAELNSSKYKGRRRTRGTPRLLLPVHVGD